MLHGTDDPLVLVAEAHALATLVPDAKRQLLFGLGHDVPGALVADVAAAMQQIR